MEFEVGGVTEIEGGSLKRIEAEIDMEILMFWLTHKLSRCEGDCRNLGKKNN